MSDKKKTFQDYFIIANDLFCKNPECFRNLFILFKIIFNGGPNVKNILDRSMIHILNKKKCNINWINILKYNEAIELMKYAGYVKLMDYPLIFIATNDSYSTIKKLDELLKILLHRRAVFNTFQAQFYSDLNQKNKNYIIWNKEKIYLPLDVIINKKHYLATFIDEKTVKLFGNGLDVRGEPFLIEYINFIPVSF